MADIQSEIEALKGDIQSANAAIAEALRKRKELPKDSPLVADFNAAVVAARQALTEVEVKIRRLYESKEDE
jgi:hypothetical protein